MGDRQVASPILRRPARFGLAASDRGYAGCELRRIHLPRTPVNKGEKREGRDNRRGSFTPGSEIHLLKERLAPLVALLIVASQPKLLRVKSQNLPPKRR